MSEVTFTSKVVGLVKDRELDALLTLLKEGGTTRQMIEEFSSEVVAVSALLFQESEYEELKKADLADKADQVLLTLAEEGNAKLAVLAFVENFCSRGEFEKFRHGLEPLLRCLRRIPESSRAKQTRFVLVSILNGLSKFEVPEFDDLSDEETMLCESDVDYYNAFEAAESVFHFIKKVQEEKLISEDLILMACLCLLDQPLSRFHLKAVKINNRMVDPKALCLARKILIFLQKIEWNFIELLEEDYSTIPEDQDLLHMQPLPGVCTLFYVAYRDNLKQDVIPYCMEPFFVFLKVKRYTIAVMDSKNLAQIEKGLDLAELLLERVTTISKEHITGCQVTDLLTALMRITRSIANSSIRQHAFFVLDSLRSKLKMEARETFFKYIYSRTDQPALRGWVVTCFKDTFIVNLKEERHLREFEGELLKGQLRTFTHLPDGVQTDLLDRKEEILAVLNAFGCMFNFDKANKSEIQDFRQEFLDNFVKTLQEAVHISIGHYKLQLSEFDEGKITKLIVSGEEMPKMSKEEAMNVLKSALSFFDLIQFTMSKFCF